MIITYSTDVFNRPRVEIRTATHIAKVYPFGDLTCVHVSTRGGRSETVLIGYCNNILHGIRLAKPAMTIVDINRCGWCLNSLALHSPAVIQRDYKGREYCPACWDELNS